MWFDSIAWAAGDARNAAQQGFQQLAYTTIIPLALLFLVFYFLLIRPQTKRQAEHRKMLGNLKRNDEVVTNGGLVGRIVELGDKLLTLEIAQNVRVRVERAQVASLSSYGKGPAKKDKGE